MVLATVFKYRVKSQIMSAIDKKKKSPFVQPTKIFEMLKSRLQNYYGIMYSGFIIITSTEWECLIFLIEVSYTTAACHFDTMCQPGAHIRCHFSHEIGVLNIHL